MVKACCVKGCKSESYAGCGISFHCLPKNEELREKWLKVIPGKSGSISKNSFVCGAHFRVEEFVTTGCRPGLKGQAIPSIFNMDMPEKKCRTCLDRIESESDTVELFTEWREPWAGMQSTMAEDLQILANISVSNEDQLSKYLCSSCLLKMQSSCIFVAQVKDIDKIMRDRLKELSPGLCNDKAWPKPISLEKSVNPEFDTTEIKEEVVSDNEYGNDGCELTDEPLAPTLDIKIEPEEIQEQSNIIVNGSYSLRDNELPTVIPTEQTNGNSFYEDEEFLEPLKEEPVSEEDGHSAKVVLALPLDCLLCTKSFKSMSGLKAHVISEHSYKSVKRKATDAATPKKSRKTDKHICTTCKRSFTTSTDLMVHETCHNKAVCYSCNSSFDTFEQLTRHRTRCEVINTKELPRVKTLEDAIRPQVDLKLTLQDDEEESDKPTLKCNLCDEKFSDDYYMNIHKEIHHSTNTEEKLSGKIKETIEIEVESRLGEVMKSDTVDTVHVSNDNLVSETINKVKTQSGETIILKTEVKYDISEVNIEFDDGKVNAGEVKLAFGGDKLGSGEEAMDGDEKMNSDDEKMETELETIFGI